MFKTKFINFVIIGHIIGGIILLLGKRDWFPDFYWPEFMGIFAFISVFLIFLPKLIFKANNEEKISSIENTQLFLAFALLLNSSGGLGLFQLYKFGFEYDKLVHLIVPFLSMLMLAQLITVWKKFEFKKTLIITVVAITIFGITWEFLEYLSDLILKSKSFGFYGEQIIKDTVMDIIFNTLGIIFGVIMLVRNNKKISKNN